MKKQVLLGVSAFLMISMSSCSNDDTLDPPAPETENPIQPETNREFGTYNALGYGYDVTGEYANANYAGSKVINIDKFKTENSSRLLDETVGSYENIEEYGADAVAYSKVLSEKVNTGYEFPLYGKTISNSFKGSLAANTNAFDSQYIYGSYNTIIKQKRYRVNATSELLANYLTPEFIKDIETRSPQQIVENYGTHVAKDIYIGAKIDVVFQAKTTNNDRQLAARVGVITAVNTLSSQVSSEEDLKEAAKNYDKKLFYRTIGGDKSKGFAQIINLENTSPKANIGAWQSTVTKDNSVLVDFGPNGLMLIYDLVNDPAKKAELKAYVDQYINTHKVVLASN